MSLEENHWDWPQSWPKNIWGAYGWEWLHKLAIEYPPVPIKTNAEIAFKRIWDFVSRLPCHECRYHALRYTLIKPPDFANSEALQHWVWEFHNDVNRRLGQAELPYVMYQHTYGKDIRLAKASWDRTISESRRRLK